MSGRATKVDRSLSEWREIEETIDEEREERYDREMDDTCNDGMCGGCEFCLALQSLPALLSERRVRA